VPGKTSAAHCNMLCVHLCYTHTELLLSTQNTAGNQLMVCESLLRYRRRQRAELVWKFLVPLAAALVLTALLTGFGVHQLLHKADNAMKAGSAASAKVGRHPVSTLRQCCREPPCTYCSTVVLSSSAHAVAGCSSASVCCHSLSYLPSQTAAACLSSFVLTVSRT